MLDRDYLGVMVAEDSFFAEIEACEHYLEEHADLFRLETELMEIFLKLELVEVVSL